MKLKEKVLGLAREKVREYYMSWDGSLSAVLLTIVLLMMVHDKKGVSYPYTA